MQNNAFYKRIVTLIFLLLSLVLAPIEMVFADSTTKQALDMPGVWEESSEEARKRQDFGFTGFKGFETFLNLYWILSEDIQLGGYYLDNFLAYDAHTHDSVNDIFGNERLVYGQYFWNSFNVMAGIGKRQIWTTMISFKTTERNNSEPDYSPPEKCYIRGEANITSLGIGNQWTFGYFVIGIRWWAVVRPIGTPKMENNCEKYDHDGEEIGDRGRTGFAYSLPFAYFGLQF